MTTHELPDVSPGTVLKLRADDWRLGTARPGPLILRVKRVRWDLFSRLWSGGYVWVEGYQLREPDHLHIGYVEVCVSYGALTERQDVTTTHLASAPQASLDVHPATVDGTYPRRGSVAGRARADPDESSRPDRRVDLVDMFPWLRIP